MADRAEVNLEITHDNILAGYSSAGVGVDHTSAMTDAFLEYLTVTICSGGNDVSSDIHHSFITSVSSNDTWSSEYTTGPGPAPLDILVLARSGDGEAQCTVTLRRKPREAPRSTHGCWVAARAARAVHGRIWNEQGGEPRLGVRRGVARPAAAIKRADARSQSSLQLDLSSWEVSRTISS